MASKSNIPGKKVPHGSYAAFVPAPLPPKLDWTPRLIRVLSDANRLIGKLAGEGGRLPNPHILMRPFLQREAAAILDLDAGEVNAAGNVLHQPGVVSERSPLAVFRD